MNTMLSTLLQDGAETADTVGKTMRFAPEPIAIGEVRNQQTLDLLTAANSAKFA